MEKPIWEWNEFQQVGTDYESEEEVAAYDQRMRKLRDIDAENRSILKLLKLKNGANVLEIGTGTGSFIRLAAKECANAVGIDVSAMMLKYAGTRAKAEGLGNIEFKHAGFLSYEYPQNYFDGVVSGLAFHHLPDTWKAVALRRIHAALKPGGRFILLDVVFDWKDESPENYFENILKWEETNRTNVARHIAQEYSTLTWIMEGLFERAGFEIESDNAAHGFLHTYCVRKK